MEQFNDEEFQFCNYGLALTTTAMALGSDYRSNVTTMVSNLKSRIRDSRNCEFKSKIEPDVDVVQKVYRYSRK